MLKKQKVIRVKDNKGILYRPVSKLSSSEILCFKECKYNKCCEYLPDPNDPENTNRCFTDFCSSLEDKDNKDSENSIELMVPKEGSLEEFFKGDNDVLQHLIKKNTLININEFIDKVCPKFLCDKYRKDHSECKFSENQMCLLRDLFLGDQEGNEEQK